MPPARLRHEIAFSENNNKAGRGMPLERFGFPLSSLRNLGSNKQITLRFFVTVTAFLAAYSAAETNFVLLWSAPRLPLPSTHVRPFRGRGGGGGGCIENSVSRLGSR